MGMQTKDDIKTLNTRWLGNDDVILPNDDNVCYACPLNKERNAIITNVFADLVEKHAPLLVILSLLLPLTVLLLRAPSKRAMHMLLKLFMQQCLTTVVMLMLSQVTTKMLTLHSSSIMIYI